MLRIWGWPLLVALLVGCTFFPMPVRAQHDFSGQAHGEFVRTPESIAFSEVVRTIVLTHPRKEVRETLNTFILEGMVVLSFDEDIALGGDGNATLLLLSIDSTSVQIVLNISPVLLDPWTPRSDQQRVVYHEYVHLEQLFSGSPAEYFFARSDSTVCSEEEARTVFRNEVDAYCQECQLAMDMGWPTDDALCAAYVTGGSAALARVLAADYVQRPCFSLYRTQLESYAEVLANRSLSQFPPR